MAATPRPALRVIAAHLVVAMSPATVAITVTSWRSSEGRSAAGAGGIEAQRNWRVRLVDLRLPAPATSRSRTDAKSGAIARPAPAAGIEAQRDRRVRMVDLSARWQRQARQLDAGAARDRRAPGGGQVAGARNIEIHDRRQERGYSTAGAGGIEAQRNRRMRLVDLPGRPARRWRPLRTRSVRT